MFESYYVICFRILATSEHTSGEFQRNKWINLWTIGYLYLLERNPHCDISTKSINPTFVNCSCTATYRGNVPPTIIFRDDAGIQINSSDIITYTGLNRITSISVLTIPANAVRTGASFLCEISVTPRYPRELLQNGRDSAELISHCRTSFVTFYGKILASYIRYYNCLSLL